MRRIFGVCATVVAFLGMVPFGAIATEQTGLTNPLPTTNVIEENNESNHDIDISNYDNQTIPDYIKPGDIIFMDKKSTKFGWFPGIQSNDHAAIYIGDNKIVQSAGEGVKIYEFDELLQPPFDFQNIRFGYVKSANESQKKMATEFVLSQVGKDYQFEFFKGGPQKNNDPAAGFLSDVWYCSEIVWAAYYNCNGTIGKGIDIDSNGWSGKKIVMPGEIISDNDIVMYDVVLFQSNHNNISTFKSCLLQLINNILLSFE